MTFLTDSTIPIARSIIKPITMSYPRNSKVKQKLSRLPKTSRSNEYEEKN